MDQGTLWPQVTPAPVHCPHSHNPPNLLSTMRGYCVDPELLLCIKRDCRIEISDLESCLKWVMWPDFPADTNQVSPMLHSNDQGWEGLPVNNPSLSLYLHQGWAAIVSTDLARHNPRAQIRAEIASNCQQPCPGAPGPAGPGGAGPRVPSVGTTGR